MTNTSKDVDNVKAELELIRGLLQTKLAAKAAVREAAAPFMTRAVSKRQYNGTRPNLGRVDWRFTIEVKDDLSECPLYLPPEAKGMICLKSLPYEWTVWVHYGVLVHHQTVRKMFKKQGNVLYIHSSKYKDYVEAKKNVKATVL